MTDIKKGYVFSYGFAESGRLHLQHWMWNMQLGWDCHPAIDLSGKTDIQVADQGCGNGAWLLSLDRSFDNVDGRRVGLRGYDIASSHFPASENLPNHMTLDVMDSFTTDLPDSLVGKFDVVHVRAFTAVVKNNDPAPVIANAIKMLKPGGYLQWDEFDGESMRAIPPRDTVVTLATQEMLDTAKVSSKVAMNIQYSWICDLGKIFKNHGLELLADTRMDVKKEVRKPMTDSLLMMYDNVSRVAVRDGCMPGTDKEWAKLWNAAGREIEEGVSIVMDMIVCVGRKPL